MSRSDSTLASVMTEYTSSATRRAKGTQVYLHPLLPGQFYGSSHHSSSFWNGERRLMLAILQDAVASWFRYRRGRSIRERRLFQETESWFAATEQEWLFSFERICLSLDLDPSYLRRKLPEWQTKVNHLFMAPRARPVLPTKLLQTPKRRRKSRGNQQFTLEEMVAIQDDAA
jgi:hypothetical protein